MAHPNEKESLHKEFELERVILFSDAVIAIAITLLVIDVKFPELPHDLQQVNFKNLFRPVVLKFLAFCISFFFIGNFWNRHLKLFKYLHQYDQGLVIRNLLFLFFIVLFPFAAETMAANIRHDFPLPVIFYIFNIAGCSLMHTVLCYYIFYKKPRLVAAGQETEKRYLFIRSKYSTIMLLSIALLTLMISILFPHNLFLLIGSFYILPIIAFIIHRKTKHLKPSKPINQSGTASETLLQ